MTLPQADSLSSLTGDDQSLRAALEFRDFLRQSQRRKERELGGPALDISVA